MLKVSANFDISIRNTLSWFIVLVMSIFIFNACFADGLNEVRGQTVDCRPQTVDCRVQRVDGRVQRVDGRQEIFYRQSVFSSQYSALPYIFQSNSASETAPACGGKLTPNTSSINTNPFQYSGYYLDAPSGLYYLNARYYSPEQQRFISRDTYDLSNRYGYCDGSPVDNVDPKGHMPKCVKTAAGIAGLGVTALGLFALNIAFPVISESLDAVEVGMVLTTATDELSSTEAITDEGAGEFEPLLLRLPEETETGASSEIQGGEDSSLDTVRLTSSDKESGKPPQVYISKAEEQVNGGHAAGIDPADYTSYGEPTAQQNEACSWLVNPEGGQPNGGHAQYGPVSEYDDSDSEFERVKIPQTTVRETSKGYVFKSDLASRRGMPAGTRLQGEGGMLNGDYKQLKGQPGGFVNETENEVREFNRSGEYIFGTQLGSRRGSV